jgi:ankyrin repeat protein
MQLERGAGGEFSCWQSRRWNAVTANATAPTRLHWAASSDDVEVLDALLDGGADIEAQGASIAGGPPLDDAVGYGQWRVARRLVERGARTRLWHAAALGLLDRMEEAFARTPPPTPQEVTGAFWQACHGGQRQSADYLLGRGADRNWVAAWDGQTPLDIADRAGHAELVAWLRSHGARPASELR